MTKVMLVQVVLVVLALVQTLVELNPKSKTNSKMTKMLLVRTTMPSTKLSLVNKISLMQMVVLLKRRRRMLPSQPLSQKKCLTRLLLSSKKFIVNKCRKC